MNRMTSSIWLKTLRRIWPAALACLPAHAAEPNFNRDIRPILSENCYLCHVPYLKHHGVHLRHDVLEEAVAVRDGAAAIVPGNPNQSGIIRRILSKDPDFMMPPPAAHHPAVPPAQVDTLKRWIAAGAPYERHWSLIAPVKSAVPAGTHPVDHFIN